jgi:hypothetical protein
MRPSGSRISARAGSGSSTWSANISRSGDDRASRVGVANRADLRRACRAGLRGLDKRGGTAALAPRHARLGDADGRGRPPGRGQDPHRHARPLRRDRGRRDRRVQGGGAASQARLHLGLGRPCRSAAADRARVLRVGRKDDGADEEQRDPHRRAPQGSGARVARPLPRGDRRRLLGGDGGADAGNGHGPRHGPRRARAGSPSSG